MTGIRFYCSGLFLSPILNYNANKFTTELSKDDCYFSITRMTTINGSCPGGSSAMVLGGSLSWKLGGRVPWELGGRTA